MKAPSSKKEIVRPELVSELVKSRSQFRSLILGNPNFFGNLEDSVFQPVEKIVSNTAFEEIGCVGYQPQLERLHAVVFVKQTTGYGGGICTAGTQEYVRFYLSFDNGASWVDQGVSGFTAHDVPENKTRLEYAVTLKIAPPRKFCFFQNIIQCRAILSWNFLPPPNMPNFQPVWGGVHDTNIPIEPRKFFLLKDFIQDLKIKLPSEAVQILDLDLNIAAAEPKAQGASALHALYKGKEVEPHRFAFKELSDFALNKEIAAASLNAGLKHPLLDLGLDIDWTKFADLFNPTDGDISYEELECVGYDQNTDTLAGIIRVKKPNGYSGGPCTAGSTEYVTFWADIDNSGSFETCLGTASVRVYDYQQIPAKGLEYSVFLPADLIKYRQPCENGPRLIPIRATLSWQTTAPCGDPDYVPVWGNREETVIIVEPGDIIPPGVSEPFVSSVGRMATNKINVNGYASGSSIDTGFTAAMSPFGGRIDIAGKIVNGTSASKYRLMVKPHLAPDSSYVPLVNEPDGLTLSVVTPPIINTVTIHADANGYYSYQDFSSSHFVDGNILMRWHTGALEDGKTYDLRIDLSVDGNPVNDIRRNVAAVRVDNTAPFADLKFTLGMGALCSKGSPGIIFTGEFTATDAHFHSFGFSIFPNDASLNVQLPVPASGLSTFYGGTIGDPGVSGGAFTLDTTGMAPCGYALILTVTDRTIVNSAIIGRQSNDSVGFCLA